MASTLQSPAPQKPPKGTSSGMPEGEELQRQLNGRKRTGKIFLALFQLAVILAILALFALLFNIVNASFGLAAIQNEVQPSEAVVAVAENKMLALPNTTSSEDDAAILAGVRGNPYAIGFVGFGAYTNDSAGLTASGVDGVTPTAESVEAGDYALARPLFIYPRADVLRSRIEVAAFVDYYLVHVDDVIGEVGFFPSSDQSQQIAAEELNESLGTPGEDIAPVTEGKIAIAGSSTLYPLTKRIASDFVDAMGFQGTISNASTGTKAGFGALCDEKNIDIAAASRKMSSSEYAACNKFFIDPVELRVGTDAVAVIINEQNTFARNLTTEQLQLIFAGAEMWSDVNPDWPAQTIARYIPGAESGTLDFFVETVYSGELAQLSAEEMIWLLNQHVSRGVLRRLEAEAPLAGRSHDVLLALVEERVIRPEVVASWNLFESVFNRVEIEAKVLADHPDANVEWYKWLNAAFLVSPQSSVPEQAGVRTAILGSLWVILITMLFAIPVGIGAAIWLEEYAGNSRYQQIVQTNIDNLAGVPSIIYGILGLTVFVRMFGTLTSGTLFGVSDPTTANGRTVISAGLTLALLVLPLVIINAQEAIRAVPKSLRDAGYGLGATKWQVTWSHVLTNAMPGILTGTILSMSRALGETAPLIVIGASTFITMDPTGPFSKFTVLPMQIYQWTSRPQDEFRHIAAAASLVLLAMLLVLNGTAIYMRNRYSKKL